MFWAVRPTATRSQVDFYALDTSDKDSLCSYWEQKELKRQHVLPPQAITDQDWQLPNDPIALLEQWYGATWRVPRRVKSIRIVAPRCSREAMQAKMPPTAR